MNITIKIKDNEYKFEGLVINHSFDLVLKEILEQVVSTELKINGINIK